MRLARNSVLIIVALAFTLVTLTSPAFATPNLTASSGSSAVAPFVTPITNSRSQYTFRAQNVSIPLMTVNETVTCAASAFVGYVDTTHTNVRITSLSFSMCRVDSGNGSVDNNGTITCRASTTKPWFLAIRTVDAARRSASGSINIPAASDICEFTVTIFRGVSIKVGFDPAQSCLPVARSSGNTYTWATRSLQITCGMRITVSGAIAFTGTTPISGTFTGRPDTARDGSLIITAAS